MSDNMAEHPELTRQIILPSLPPPKKKKKKKKKMLTIKARQSVIALYFYITSLIKIEVEVEVSQE